MVIIISEKKVLVERPPWFEGDDESAPGLDTFYLGWDTWELGEGYTLTVKSLEFKSDPRKARLVLRRNGVELDDVWLSSGCLRISIPAKLFAGKAR